MSNNALPRSWLSKRFCPVPLSSDNRGWTVHSLLDYHRMERYMVDTCLPDSINFETAPPLALTPCTAGDNIYSVFMESMSRKPSCILMWMSLLNYLFTGNCTSFWTGAQDTLCDAWERDCTCNAEALFPLGGLQWQRWAQSNCHRVWFGQRPGHKRTDFYDRLTG